MKLIAALTLLVAGVAFGQTSADKKQLDSLTAQYRSAKIAYGKSHGSASTKRRLVVATDQLATATMTSDALNPRTRYPPGSRPLSGCFEPGAKQQRG